MIGQSFYLVSVRSTRLDESKSATILSAAPENIGGQQTPKCKNPFRLRPEMPVPSQSRLNPVLFSSSFGAEEAKGIDKQTTSTIGSPN